MEASLSPESLAAVEKIRAQVIARRLELQDDFADFDHLRSKGITPAQFTRVLSRNQVDLAPDELAALIREFSVMPAGALRTCAHSPPNRPPHCGSVHVNYQAFIQTLKEHLRREGRDPHPQTANPSILKPTRADEDNKNEKEMEEEQLRAVEQRIRHLIQSRGLNVVAAFKGMDPLRTGKVTESQFTRCITLALQQHLSLFTPPSCPSGKTSTGGGCSDEKNPLRRTVLELILKKYGDGHGDVHYMAWCRDVDDTLSGNTAGASHGKNYRDDKNTMNQEGGCPFATLGSPLGGVFGKTAGVCNPNLSSEELLDILRAQFSVYRLRCEDYFTDFDPFKTGLVTAPQFESALGRLEFVKFNLTPENISTLIRAYAADSTIDKSTESFTMVDTTAASVSPYQRVCYIKFLHDTNPKNFPSRTSSPSSGNNVSVNTNTNLISMNNGNNNSVNYFHKTHASNAFLSSAQERSEADRILEKVRRQVSTNRIFLTPVLRDMDRVRKSIYEHRICTAPRFARALATQKIILPQKELELLIRKYTIPHADGTPSDDVHYYQFVVDVDPTQANDSAAGKAASPSTQDGKVTFLMSSAPSPTTTPREKATTEGKEEALDLSSVLQQICQQAEARRLRVDAFFPDFDPLRSGRLARSHFITALSTAGLVLGEGELGLLADAYARRAAGRDAVDVGAFLRDFEAAACARREAGAGAGAAEEDPPGLTPDERAQLARVLGRLRQRVAAANALLTPFFADFDRHRRGAISRANFAQACRRHEFVLDAAETALLARAYAAPAEPTCVAYRAFIAALDGDEGTHPRAREMTAQPPPATAEAPAPCDTDAAATVEGVLDKIADFVRVRRPNVGEFFPDGDELRHGRVSHPRFRHCVSLLGPLTLTAAEFARLEEAFAEGDGVNYPAFVAAVRARLASGGGATTSRGFSSAFSSMKTEGTSSDGKGALRMEEKLYTEVIGKLRRKLGSRRTQSLMAFREYDRARKGYVKEGQFFACLCALLGAPQTPLEASILTKTFSSGNGEMAYERFCAEVDDGKFKAVS